MVFQVDRYIAIEYVHSARRGGYSAYFHGWSS